MIVVGATQQKRAAHYTKFNSNEVQQ